MNCFNTPLKHESPIGNESAWRNGATQGDPLAWVHNYETGNRRVDIVVRGADLIKVVGYIAPRTIQDDEARST